jgi:hypothetical protein
MQASAENTEWSPSLECWPLPDISTIFAGKARSILLQCCSGAPLRKARALPANGIHGWKFLKATNTLAYYDTELISNRSLKPRRRFKSPNQGKPTEGEGSVHMTSSLRFVVLLKKVSNILSKKELNYTS